jgi:thiamine pyrophosphate-dependent acetolactate synthase large subunit-like protein
LGQPQGVAPTIAAFPPKKVTQFNSTSQTPLDFCGRVILSKAAAQANIVHIDIDPTSIRKNIPVTVPIVGNYKISLILLNKMLEEENLTGIS